MCNIMSVLQPKLACFRLNGHFVVFNGRKESRDFALVIITPFLLA